MKKNNFLLYKDFETTLDLLNNEQSGKLFKAIYRYVNGRNEPDFESDGMLKVAFNIIKTQLERDLVKYQNTVEKNKINGAKGGRPSNKGEKTEPVIEKPKKPSGLNENPTKPKKADSDSVSDSERDSDSDKIKEIVEFLNSTLHSNYRYTSNSTKKNIKARLNEGFSVDDFKKVITTKYKDWNNTDMSKYLRPDTLFGNKFESYLNQIPKKTHIGFDVGKALFGDDYNG